MGGMLSQDEINALLSGEKEKQEVEGEKEQAQNNSEPENEVDDQNAQSPDESDPKAELETELEPEPELEAKSVNNAQEDNLEETIEAFSIKLTDEEKDIIGEIGNITMGTSATTLYALLSQRVLITTPIVSIMRWEEIGKNYERPCVGIRVDYTEGIEGTNLLILREDDVKIISNLMMGGTGEEDMERELNELDLSAIAEAMNQMVGSSSTSLSSLVKIRIDIDTPKAFRLDFQDRDFLENVSFTGDEVICTKFRMEIGTLIDSEIMQIIPLKFAMDMVEVMKGEIVVNKSKVEENANSKTSVKSENIEVKNENPKAVQIDNQKVVPNLNQGTNQNQNYGQNENVNVQSVQFQNFDVSEFAQQKENIDIIMDVPLNVTVELGRTSKKIREILEFSPGTIIELDKLAGEPIDILVNGKFVAKGEVVVIDENFGVRVTDIINREQRVM